MSPLDILSKVTGQPEENFQDISNPRFANIKTYQCDSEGDEYTIMLTPKGEVAQIKSNQNHFDKETVAQLVQAALMCDERDRAIAQAIAEAAAADKTPVVPEA